MTPRLHEAFLAAASLPPAEQDMIATWLLAEIDVEEVFDRALQATGKRLAGLATDALDEHRRGETQTLDPEKM